LERFNVIYVIILTSSRHKSNVCLRNMLRMRKNIWVHPVWSKRI